MLKKLTAWQGYACMFGFCVVMLSAMFALKATFGVGAMLGFVMFVQLSLVIGTFTMIFIAKHDAKRAN